MDANRTRFHLLLGRSDWAGCRWESSATGPRVLLAHAWNASPPDDSVGLAYDGARNELTLQARLFRFLPTANDTPLDLSARRGADRDRYGNWYWIDADGHTIKVESTGSGNTSDFWPNPQTVCDPPRYGDFRAVAEPAAPPPPPLGGLAVTERHYLVAGTLDPPGLLVFDLHAGGPPRHLLWPSAIPFAPFDMAAAPGGGLFVLDRAHLLYWAFDCNFNVIKRGQGTFTLSPGSDELFQPVARDAVRHLSAELFPTGLSLVDASPLTGLDPIAIEALPDGTVLVLDRRAPFAEIRRYRDGLLLGRPVSADITVIVEKESRLGLALRGHDFAFVAAPAGSPAPARLYIASEGGKQAFAFSLFYDGDQLGIEPIAQEYLPMRLFGGKSLVAAGGQAFYDFADGFIPLVRQRRPRYEASAALHAGPFDGREPDCRWHRLMLDGCIPAGTSVRAYSRAANDAASLALADWTLEPRPYLRGGGSELPFVSSRGLLAGPAGSEASRLAPLGSPAEPTSPDQGTFELLFQRARGRYLELRLILDGSGGSTPRLRALRAYYPRFSYLDQYLPGTYREDGDSASFLDRFLANPEGIFTAIEDKVAAVQLLFDVRSAPPETLDWLASWFGVALDPAWDELKRRLFIRHAMDFFRFRGTARGLRMALELVMTSCPSDELFSDDPRRIDRSGIRIIESFRKRVMPPAVLGDPTDRSGIRAVSPSALWNPQLGAEALDADYVSAVKQAGLPPPGGFPTRPPADPAETAIWRDYTQRVLGFVPYSSPSQSNTRRDRSADDLFWRDFLARRYQRVSELNGAYETPGRYSSFGAVPFPERLPGNPAALFDWYQFARVAQAMRQRAHHFTVLLPVPPAEVATVSDREARRALCKRVVELEKPAHTIFDVRYYWAMFRLGEARLGDDTTLGLGGRDPAFLPPLVLGQGYLAEGQLAPRPPQDAQDRDILGRDMLGH